ncbi:NADH dehydrogenase [ubiquinone] 1 alpha subcomplex subunit 3-like [Meriones unguiculatus]|uniref:NADH dehydrogenase [ubiquinone] 1 alpha subcomplex subunit 3-like n=1 Tax=Meriones unguiculatus TaxID=10047 RepID=UPI00293F2BCD|nr:NADH dehydrogenase [ubiquinone] 1 alpha subcomplex subunit 3-like [Meriones unguiculatus]
MMIILSLDATYRHLRFFSAKTKIVRRLFSFLKNTWTKEVVLVWGLVIIVSIVSSYTKYATSINQTTPYNYPVPVQDNGYMPNVPIYPWDLQGLSLEWLKML